MILLSFINKKITYLYSLLYNLILKIFVILIKIISKIPFSQILVTTPNIIWLILYYLLIYIVIEYAFLRKYYSNRYIVKLIEKFKIWSANKIKQLRVYIIVIMLICNLIHAIPSELKIYFIDVGQGDSTLIVTPYNKKIIIDGGGSDSYDVGENTLLPYLLDRKIKTIDYMIISHFDSDHCKRLIYFAGKN